MNINKIIFFENFILRINRGMEAVTALEKDLNTIKSPFMKNVFINIQSVIENNGDMLKLLSKFEHEAFNIEKTLYNNNIRNYKDRIFNRLFHIKITNEEKIIISNTRITTLFFIN